MSIRDEQSHQVATMYYLQGRTMGMIAHQLGVSRSTVSRLLSYARATGLVQISVAPEPGERGTLAGEIGHLFGVSVSVVPVADVDTEVNRLRNVAAVGAERLVQVMHPGATLGIAWGNTTAEVTRALGHVEFPGSTVVQLNGAANAYQSGLPYADAILSKAADAFGSRMVSFPVPAFFDYVETKRALWRERSIRRVLNLIEHADVALFGIGAMEASLLSHVYTGGFLEQREIDAAKADGVVGDVCTVLIREDGSTDMALNQRASGPPTALLRRIPRRLCVVSGVAKALPLIGALRSGVVTDLVLDSTAARAVLERVRTGATPKRGGRRTTMGR